MLELYGSRWKGFVEECEPKQTRELKKLNLFEETAHKVELEAVELYQILSENYDRTQPPKPDDWYGGVVWEETKRMFIRSQVERDVCLQVK
jgi:hypothetical protein